MIADDEWIDQQVRRAFESAVVAGIGQWAHGQNYTNLGDSIYEYRADGLVICLCNAGLCYVVDEIVQVWKYEDIDEILPSPLRDLARAGGPEGRVNIGIRVRDVLGMIEIPLKVYSSLCPILLKLVTNRRGPS
jgi:hypothetical protein